MSRKLISFLIWLFLLLTMLFLSAQGQQAEQHKITSVSSDGKLLHVTGRLVTDSLHQMIYLKIGDNKTVDLKYNRTFTLKGMQYYIIEDKLVSGVLIMFPGHQKAYLDVNIKGAGYLSEFYFFKHDD